LETPRLIGADLYSAKDSKKYIL